MGSRLPFLHVFLQFGERPSFILESPTCQVRSLRHAMAKAQAGHAFEVGLILQSFKDDFATLCHDAGKDGLLPPSSKVSLVLGPALEIKLLKDRHAAHSTYEGSMEKTTIFGLLQDLQGISRKQHDFHTLHG